MNLLLSLVKLIHEMGLQLSNSSYGKVPRSMTGT